MPQKQPKKTECNRDHGGNQEIGRTEKDKTENGKKNPGKSRQVLSALFPLFHKDNDKKCRHGKIDSGGIKGKSAPQDVAGNASHYLVKLIQQGKLMKGFYHRMLFFTILICNRSDNHSDIHSRRVSSAICGLLLVILSAPYRTHSFTCSGVSAG